MRIVTESAKSHKLAPCSHSKCNTYFLIDERRKFKDTDFLCPECKSKLETHNIIQCRSCKSIINFTEVEDREYPIVLYAKNCHLCTGSFEGELRVQPFMYPELFM